MTSKRVREFLRSHVLGLVAIFIALTGTAVAGGPQSGTSDGPQASTSAVTAKKFKALKARVAALEAKPGVPASLPPSGPAGGDLTGTYPNPLIGPDAVGSAEIADLAVTTQKLADLAVTNAKLGNDVVTSGKIQDGQVTAADLGTTVVRTATDPGVPTGASSQQIASCLAGEKLLSGGGSWSGALGASNLIKASRPSGNSWIAQGTNSSGGPLDFTAHALCLQ